MLVSWGRRRASSPTVPRNGPLRHESFMSRFGESSYSRYTAVPMAATLLAQNAGLVQRGGLLSLTSLRLANTQVTDAGLAHLEGLSELQSFGARGDPGHRRRAVAFPGVKKLRILIVRKTQVSKRGLLRVGKGVAGPPQHAGSEASRPSAPSVRQRITKGLCHRSTARHSLVRVAGPIQRG